MNKHYRFDPDRQLTDCEIEAIHQIDLANTASILEYKEEQRIAYEAEIAGLVSLNAKPTGNLAKFLMEMAA